VQRCLQRISGPLLDRIDIHIDVPRLQHEELLGRPQGEPSAVIRERVVKARQIQQERFANERRPLYANGAMEAGQIRKYSSVDREGKELVRSAIQQKFSERSLGDSPHSRTPRLEVRLVYALDDVMDDELHDGLQLRYRGLHLGLLRGRNDAVAVGYITPKLIPATGVRFTPRWLGKCDEVYYFVPARRPV
jgi:hypothetical protein